MAYSQVEVQPDGTLRVPVGPALPDLRAAQRRMPLLVFGLCAAMLAIFVFASYDIYLPTPSTLALYERFMQGAPVFKGYISYFEMTVLGTALLLLERYGTRFMHSRLILRIFFTFALAGVVLDLLNPNDEAPKLLGIPLLNNISSYIYLLFMFVIFFMREDGFLVFIRRAGITAGLLVMARTAYQLFLWVIGDRNYKFGGLGSSLTEGDSLMVFAFFATLLLALFFTRRRLAYLGGWALLFALQILSFRRSATYVVLGSNAFVVLMNFLTRTRLGALLRNAAILVFVAMVGGLIVVQTVPEETSRYYFDRYFGMFFGMGQSEATKYAGDSGHFAESAMTISYAFNKMEFWGYGGGPLDRINIPGATERVWVHNVFAAAWLYHGVYQFLFYALMFLVMVLMGVRVFFQRNRYDPRFIMLQAGLVGFFIMMMVIWYTNPIHIAEALKMRVFWATLMACIFRITPANFAVLFGEKPEPAPQPLPKETP